jgi:DinB superfamily
MDTKLQTLFNDLEASKADLLRYISHLDETQINWKSQPDKWSVGQIIEHLTLAEKYMLANITNKLNNRETLIKVGFKTKVKLLLMKAIVRSPFKPKVKAPARLAAVAQHQNLGNLKVVWNEKRVELKSTLEEITPDLLDKNLASHPLIPDLTILHGLGILQGHFNIHKKQIEGVMREM